MHILLCAWIHEISIPNISSTYHPPCPACVCVSFWISCGVFRHRSIVHLRFALLSIARHESPGWDWLRAPLIAGDDLPTGISNIYRPISWTILVLFLPIVRGLVSILLFREERSDREWTEIIYKNFTICVSLNCEYPFAIKSLFDENFIIKKPSSKLNETREEDSRVGSANDSRERERERGETNRTNRESENIG